MTRVIDTYELSPMQAGMLFHAVSEGASGVDIEQVVATLHEPLDEVKFLRAWQRVANRHSILRSRLRRERLEVPVQDVVDEIQIPVEQFDWRAFGKAERDQKFQALLDSDRVRGFDLEHAPLMRLTIVRAEEREYWVLWTFHHILIDGRSFPLVLREVFAFYEAFSRGADLDLPLPRPYRDHIEWLRKLDMDSSKGYWQDALAGFRAPTPLVVTRDRQREQVNGTIRGAQEVRLSAALTTALNDRARDASVTVNTLLQGAWALLLHRYSGEPDIVFGATRACRGSTVSDAHGMVGLFINTLPMRVRIDPETEVVPWLQQLRARQVELRDYEHSPLVKVQGWSDVPRGTPLFESVLVFDDNTLDARLRSLGGAWSERRFQQRGQTNFPLSLAAYGDPELLLQLEYSRRRFDDDVVARMLDHLRTLLEGMAVHPQARLKDLRLLTESEQHQLLAEWNDTNTDYPASASIQELFEAQAARTPEAVAVEYEGLRLTYGELNARANQVARYLARHGVGPDALVGICVERSLEMVVGILGILKAGGAYVPLDPEYPASRLSFMLEDTAAPVLLTQATLRDKLPAYAGRTVSLDADWPQIAREGQGDLGVEVSARNFAYVIYTSGSTGKPKGVVVPHRAVVNFLTSMMREPGLTADDVLVAVTTLSFDIAVLELYLPLTLGATVVIASRDEAMDGQALKGLLEQHRASVMQATPVTWRLLLEAGWKGGPPFKALVGGEALPKDLADQLIARGVELWNLYGPTETTVWSTCARITDTSNGITIGKPIANTTVYILDAQSNLCPIGVPGELCIGGVGVTLGYLNRPELTAERFIPDPFSATVGATLYRTGDRARWRSDGTLEHLGRLDHQVKVRGFRVELGEIETILAEHPAVRQAAVHLWQVKANDVRIVACCVPAKAGILAPIKLRKHLRARLPQYMVPQHFLLVEEIPLTPNGKVDRSKLPTPAVSLPGDGHSYAAPRTPTENAIAQIWSAVLGMERVGINDNFFALGGYSLLLLRAQRCAALAEPAGSP